MSNLAPIDFKIKRDRSKEILKNHQYQEISQQAVSQYPLLYDLRTQHEHNKQVFPCSMNPSFKFNILDDSNSFKWYPTLFRERRIG